MNYLAAMEMELLKIDRNQISINAKDLSSILGTSGGEMDQHTMELIEKYIVECKEIMTPKGGYVLFEADGLELKEEIEIEGMRFHIGKILKRMLRSSERYALFAVTAGPEPERLSKSFMDSNQFLEGYIVDLIGSGIVDSVASQLHQHIKNHAEDHGKKTTNRYSPGYCSWDVAEQQKLFSLLPDGCCGITLTESSLMSPIKSVSGIIGIGTSVKYEDFTCEICPMKNCLFRKTLT